MTGPDRLSLSRRALILRGAALAAAPIAGLRLATTRALGQLAVAGPPPARRPVRVRMRFGDGAQASVMEAIPGVVAQDATTIAFTAPSMHEAYRLVRFIYRFTRV